MTIYSEDSDGNIIVTFDSRWQFPETLGYKPEDPQYKLLRKLWEQATGEAITDKATPDSATEVLYPTD